MCTEKYIEAFSETGVHVQGQGTSRQKNRSSTERLADECFEENCNINIGRKCIFKADSILNFLFIWR